MLSATSNEKTSTEDFYKWITYAWVWLGPVSNSIFLGSGIYTAEATNAKDLILVLLDIFF